MGPKVGLWWGDDLFGNGRWSNRSKEHRIRRPYVPGRKDSSSENVNSQLLSPPRGLLFSPSSLANSCTFLVGVWRIIKDLARSALATVPGRRRRVLFLVRLKNRRTFSLRFLCLSCNAHDSGGIFCSRKVKKTWNSFRVPRLVDVEDNPLRVPYIEDEIWGSSLRTKLKEGMSSKINFVQFPREPSTAKSASLHKGAIECAFRTLKPMRKLITLDKYLSVRLN